MYLQIALLFSYLFAQNLGAPLENDDSVSISPKEVNEDYRLPLHITPKNYNITLKPHLDPEELNAFTFEGETKIKIVPSKSTKEIVLHAKNLVIFSSKYWDLANPNQALSLSIKDHNSVTDKLTLETSMPLTEKSTYVLYFQYNGTMDDDMHGFYRSSYVDSENNTKWIGSTQFQTHHARRAFPSFDEPNFKATFDVTIIHHKSMQSWSNTRKVSSKLEGDNVIDTYETTPPMSTYILAFIVSQFSENFDGEFGIIARPEFYTQTAYSYSVGKAILKSLGDYFSINYYDMGVKKMHNAAIPDFSAGAMENWGLLTYRETALLFDPLYTPLSSQQSIAAVIAHEEAHMWFGDYVTCDWWSYTWLNEGFARYFQYFGTAMVEKEWELEKQFVVAQLQSVMYMDSTNNTNPMTDENTNSPSDLSRMFNSISYNKGASVIRMIKHVMTEPNFRQSLQEYLIKYNYTNTKPNDLLESWRSHWPQDTVQHADGIFKSFTEQVGYPVVTVNVSTDRKSFRVSQTRFLLKNGDGSDNSLRYTIPFTFTTSDQKDFNSTTPKHFLLPITNEMTINVESNFSWIVANIQQTGYYRVNYDVESWHKIHHSLLASDWGEIPEVNRAQIVDDLLNLARAGVIDYDLCFAVLDYLETETNYVPWRAAFNGYSFLEIRLGNNTSDFKSYMTRQLYKAFVKLGFVERTNDTALDIYNRANVISWYCKNGNTACISHSLDLFRSMDHVMLPKNIAAVVYCVAMREGTEGDYNTLLAKYKSTTVATEKINILNNLGCVKDSALIEKHFDFIITDNVRRQDKSSALTTLYTSNNENVWPVFNLVTEKYNDLAEAMGSYSSVATVISNIASRFTEEAQLQKLKEFNSKNKDQFGSSLSTLTAAEVTVQENLNWDNRLLAEVRNNLHTRSTGGSALKDGITLTFVLITALVSVILQ